jgi:hypothetical protein
MYLDAKALSKLGESAAKSSPMNPGFFDAHDDQI